MLDAHELRREARQQLGSGQWADQIKLSYQLPGRRAGTRRGDFAMTTLRGHWEDLIAEFLDETDDPSDPEVVEAIETGWVGFAAGTSAVLARLAEGATALEVARELEELYKSMENRGPGASP